MAQPGEAPAISLKAKRLLITGGASGIGKATAELAHRAGAQIALLDVQGEALAVVAASLGGTTPDQVRGWTVDLSDYDQTRETVNEASGWLGGIDVLVHVAGVMRGQGALITDVESDVWDDVIAINLSASFNVTKCVVREMLQRGSGVVILTGSGAGVSGPSGSIPYGASKGGVHGLAMTLAAQLAPLGIRVNDVLPGLVDTPLVRRSIEDGIHAGLARSDYDAALLNVCTPEDVAKVMIFLASDEASHVRGTITTR